MKKVLEKISVKMLTVIASDHWILEGFFPFFILLWFLKMLYNECIYERQHLSNLEKQTESK